MDAIKIGVIGGSGLYDMETLQDVSSVKLDTPFGSPSDEYIVGTGSSQCPDITRTALILSL